MDEDGTIRLAPGVAVSRGALAITAIAGGGPGGQHANKTATKVELRVRVADLAGLHRDAVERLRALAGPGLLTGEDEILITCDTTRSQRQNRDEAIERLRELVLAAQVRPRVRKRSKPSWGSVQRRLETKSHNSQRKRNRSGPLD